MYENDSSRSSPLQCILGSVYSLLDITKKDYTHSHRRGVYFMPLYKNYREFLCDKIKEKSLEPIDLDWNDWWLRKSNTRVRRLRTEGRENLQPLFHHNIHKKDLSVWLSARGV